MSQQLLGLTRKHGDKVVVLKIDVDRQGELARRAGVRSIPDTRLYFAGRELERRIGGLSQSKLSTMVVKHAEKLPSSASSGKSPQTVPVQPSIIPLTKSGKPVQGKAGDPAPKDAAESGTIVPMGKDWLPPGVTRN